MSKNKTLDKLLHPITKLVFENAVDSDKNYEFYIEGWPCDRDVADMANRIMDENFDDCHGELLLLRMEFIGMSFINKDSYYDSEDSDED